MKEDPEEDERGGSSSKKKGKRDKYKGGLVFEPNRGLWDKFILVMDFNSLYPSIIQEYNIDFTTVEPIEEEDEVCYPFIKSLNADPYYARMAKREFRNLPQQTFLKVFFLVLSQPWSTADDKSRL